MTIERGGKVSLKSRGDEIFLSAGIGSGFSEGDWRE